MASCSAKGMISLGLQHLFHILHLLGSSTTMYDFDIQGGVGILAIFRLEA